MLAIVNVIQQKMNNSNKSYQRNEIDSSRQGKAMYRCHTTTYEEAMMYDHTPKSPPITSHIKHANLPPTPRVRNGTYTSTTITTKNSPRSVVPSKFVEHTYNNKYYHNHRNSCNDTESCTNTVAKGTLKHPPKPQSPSTVMADIPLRHSSYTRTLLPGLRRKNSIRRPTPRSQWEQILQNASFSLVSSSSSSSSISTTTTSSSLSSDSIIIKPPKHTQRILKYDPITGNAYNNNNSHNGSSSSSRNSDITTICPRNSIMTTLLGLIPRSKLSVSLWKMTMLVSFLYINLHLFHLQVEHHQISELLASMVNIEPYQQLSPHFSHNHHRRLHPHHYHALRGSVTTSVEEYYTQHSDHPDHLLRGSKTSTHGSKVELDTNPDQDRLATPVEEVTNLPDAASLSAAVVETIVANSNDTNPKDVPATEWNTRETHQSKEEDQKNTEKKVDENQDSSNKPNDIPDDNEDDEEAYILTNHEESSTMQ